MEVYKYVDGQYVQLTPEQIAEDRRKAQEDEDARIAAGGCPHPMEEWVHYTFESSRGGDQDAYDCGRCGELMQVG
jgi:hypothetical protein